MSNLEKLKVWIMQGMELVAGAVLAFVAGKMGQSKAPSAVAQAPQGELIETGETRGIRNRNAGNVTVLGGGKKWRGQVGEDRVNDGYGHAYAIFDTQHNGIRACALVLRNYQRLRGINTVAGLINRYAPPAGGNPSDDYAKFVSNRMHVGVDEQINLIDDGTLVELVEAVIYFENGFKPFSALTISTAVADI